MFIISDGRELFIDMVADPASLSLAFRKIQGQFDSVFTPFIHQKPKLQPDCQLWTAYKPRNVSGIGATLPAFCSKCRGTGSSANKKMVYKNSGPCLKRNLLEEKFAIFVESKLKELKTDET